MTSRAKSFFDWDAQTDGEDLMAETEVISTLSPTNPCPHYKRFRCSRSFEVIRDRIQARMRGVPCDSTDAVCEV
jgi:hypothetical protein